ncbi:MAG: type II toxin-antitoxin system ParD family antitoxin [Alphaproteobacteria bacterium]|nr:type II toxin-antitoxin system ParD family antitoxin [Alphaproteobacteria bacterium]
MSKIEKISVALPRDMVDAIKDAVEAGDYATTSEVIRDAIRDWRLKRHVEAMDVDELRRLVAPALDALDRGEGIPAEEVFAQLKAKYAAMARKTEK